MNTPEVLLPLVGVILLSYLVQTVTGFGAMIVAITLGALVLPIESVLSIAVPLSLVQNAWIVAKHHGGIDRRLLFVTILPLMSVGMVGGFVLSESIDSGGALRIAFGVMVLFLAIRELYVSFRTSSTPPAPLGLVGTGLSILGAGVVHGIYATGGPLLVYAVGRLELGKHVFRSTLTAVWMLLNIVLTTMMVFTARITTETVTASALLLPTIPVGVILGELIHHRVDEVVFRRLLFALLALASLPLILR